MGTLTTKQLKHLTALMDERFSREIEEIGAVSARTRAVRGRRHEGTAAIFVSGDTAPRRRRGGCGGGAVVPLARDDARASLRCVCLDVAAPAAHVVLDPAAQAVEGLRHRRVRIVVAEIGRRRVAGLDGAPVQRHAGVHVVAVAVPVVALARAYRDLAGRDVAGEARQPLRAPFDPCAQGIGCFHAIEQYLDWNGREGHGLSGAQATAGRGMAAMLTNGGRSTLTCVNAAPNRIHSLIR